MGIPVSFYKQFGFKRMMKMAKSERCRNEKSKAVPAKNLFYLVYNIALLVPHVCVEK